MWHAAPDRAGLPEARAACLELLDAGERERLDRFRFEADALAYLAAHALLRSALSQVAPVHPGNWRFRRRPGGRPEVEAPARHRHLSFSLSHTRGRVAVAVANGGDVGIDVELAEGEGRLRTSLKRLFAPSEVEAIESGPPSQRERRTLEFWTLKEAFLKASGTGLTAELDEVAFQFGGDRVAKLTMPYRGEDPDHWFFGCFSASDVHPVALAIRRPPGAEVQVQVREASALPLGRPAPV
ncbi:MAG: 4'-phosphopantetheinyl transferase superfamily protein [Anaeromyxobacteraceae bacterium]